jgi:hypothetical protein
VTYTLTDAHGITRAIAPNADGQTFTVCPPGGGVSCILAPDPARPGVYTATRTNGTRPTPWLRCGFIRDGDAFRPARPRATRPAKLSTTIRGKRFAILADDLAVSIRPHKGRSALTVPWSAVLALAERLSAPPIPAAPARKRKGRR